MIRVSVTLFAHARDLAGTGQVVMELPVGATSASLLSLLVERYPRLAELREHVRLAVNRAYAPSSKILSDGDEVAVIPPVSGG